MNNQISFFVGTYEKANTESLFKFSIDKNSLDAVKVDGYKGFNAPSYLCQDIENNKIFAVEEMSSENGETGSCVSCLDLISGEKTSSIPTIGTLPCHVLQDKKRNLLITANYGGGSVTAFDLDENSNLKTRINEYRHTGNSINTKRQEAPHAHFTGFDMDNNSLWVVDLGIDCIKNYSLSNNALVVNSEKDIPVKKGCGPRHFCFAENYMYVVCELSNEVLVIDTKTKETLQVISTLNDDNVKSACAAIKTYNKFVYVSNRGGDSIAVYRIMEDGLLELIEITDCIGKNPRDFAIFEDIMLVANQSSNSITIFKINPDTGKLNYTGKTISCPKPVCII